MHYEQENNGFVHYEHRCTAGVQGASARSAEAIFDYFLNHFFLNVHYEQENNGFVHYEHK